MYNIASGDPGDLKQIDLLLYSRFSIQTTMLEDCDSSYSTLTKVKGTSAKSRRLVGLGRTPGKRSVKSLAKRYGWTREASNELITCTIIVRS